MSPLVIDVTPHDRYALFSYCLLHRAKRSHSYFSGNTCARIETSEMLCSLISVMEELPLGPLERSHHMV